MLKFFGTFIHMFFICSFILFNTAIIKVAFGQMLINREYKVFNIIVSKLDPYDNN